MRRRNSSIAKTEWQNQSNSKKTIGARKTFKVEISKVTPQGMIYRLNMFVDGKTFIHYHNCQYVIAQGCNSGA